MPQSGIGLRIGRGSESETWVAVSLVSYSLAEGILTMYMMMFATHLRDIDSINKQGSRPYLVRQSLCFLAIIIELDTYAFIITADCIESEPEKATTLGMSNIICPTKDYSFKVTFKSCLADLQHLLRGIYIVKE